MRCILLFVITEKILELPVYFDKFRVSVLNCRSIIEELEEIFELQIYRIKRKKVNNKQKLTVKDKGAPGLESWTGCRLVSSATAGEKKKSNPLYFGLRT